MIQLDNSVYLTTDTDKITGLNDSNRIEGYDQHFIRAFSRDNDGAETLSSNVD
jgi:hypothetical protein